MYSIKVVQGTWGGLSLHYGAWGSAGINTSAYGSVQLAVFGGTSGANISVMFENDPGSAFPKINYGLIPANTWKIISLPVAQLNPAGYAVNRLDVMEMSGSPRTYYVDNLGFVQGTAVALQKDSGGDKLTPATAPKEFELGQNYPNPFNPTTSIKYSLPMDAFVSVEVYNTLGQLVQSLANETQTPGEHEVTLNASNMPSGAYFYRMTARSISGDREGSFVQTRKMMLVK